MEEKYIQTQEQLCKGLILKKEFILQLSKGQLNVIREVANECDCSTGEVYEYLIEDKNRKLLLQLFNGDLNSVKEKLIEVVFISGSGLDF